MEQTTTNVLLGSEPARDKFTKVVAWYHYLLNLAAWPSTYTFSKIKLLLNVWHTHTWLPYGSHLRLRQYEDDRDKLATLLTKAKTQSIMLISVDVHAWDIDQSKITDIGISTRLLGSIGELRVRSYHWQIKENISLRNKHVLNNSSIFTFGSTKIIPETQISTILNGIIEPLETRFQNIAIVGHDICFLMGLLKNHWEPPGSVILLDTQKIWQQQHARLDQVTFEEALRTTSNVEYDRKLLDNAGNDARFTLHLLQAQSTFQNIQRDANTGSPPRVESV
ncbi:hypothetical protein GGR53DRAFT_305390 [Hypoxylon sp. FL1150]|nr:hypothetical protein GGR53DRAFT_305390 [Hypoxylon sp. FL1150]